MLHNLLFLQKSPLLRDRKRGKKELFKDLFISGFISNLFSSLRYRQAHLATIFILFRAKHKSQHCALLDRAAILKPYANSFLCSCVFI